MTIRMLVAYPPVPAGRPLPSRPGSARRPGPVFVGPTPRIGRVRPTVNSG
ncbi:MULTISPECIES: hypothetical protein [Micromonospora]|nr:hypothetical protein [Micromonospora sp. WP24]